jgi:hypothetical protein
MTTRNGQRRGKLKATPISVRIDYLRSTLTIYISFPQIWSDSRQVPTKRILRNISAILVFALCNERRLGLVCGFMVELAQKNNQMHVRGYADISRGKFYRMVAAMR